MICLKESICIRNYDIGATVISSKSILLSYFKTMIILNIDLCLLVTYAFSFCSCGNIVSLSLRELAIIFDFVSAITVTFLDTAWP